MFRTVLVYLALAVLAFPLALLAWERTPYVTGEMELPLQPVKFDHRHHVRDAGIACTYCHAEVKTSASAGMPAVSLCMGCHAQIWTDSPELAPVRASAFSGAPLAWQRVTKLPDFVFFNHAVHVNQGVACESCHGRVDLMAQVYAVQPFNMKFCLDCHRAPEKFLHRREQGTAMEWSAEGRQLALGRTAPARSDVHPGLDCTTCHR